MMGIHSLHLLSQTFVRKNLFSFVITNSYSGKRVDVNKIEAHYTKRAKKLDATFAAGNNSNPSAYKSYAINGIDSLVVGHFGEVNKGFKQLICSLAKVAAESQEAGNITPASSTDHKRKGAYALFKKRFKVALGCIAGLRLN